MALSKKQIKQLRTLANPLSPLLYVGKNDISEASIKQARETIAKHELMKFAVQDGSGLSAKEAAERFSIILNAEIVQIIGNRFVLYKETKLDDVEKIRLVRA